MKLIKDLKLPPLVKSSIPNATTIALIGSATVLAILLIWAIPMLIVKMWNDFFHAIFHLPPFYYMNAVSLVFWVLFVVGLFVLLKEVE